MFKRKLLTLVSAAMVVTTTAQAQSYSKTFARSQAQDPGISAQLCQNDMMIVTAPGVVKAVGVTLPNNVETQFDGNRVILRGNVTTGRTPIVILMRDSDDIYRMHLAGCPTRGASTLIKIVDDAPAPAAAREFTAQPVPVAANPVAPAGAGAAAPTSVTALNPVAAATTGVITLPAVTSATLDVSRTATGLTLTVANGTAQTLALRPENLRVTVGGKTVTVPATATGNVAPGLTGAYTIPVPTDLAGTDVSVNWMVQVPSLRAQFPLLGGLK